MAFKRFGPRHRPEAVSALSDAMLTDRDDLVRTHAALALAGVAFDDRAAARPAVPALARALGDKAARVNAALALANLGRDANPAVPDVVRALTDGRDRRSLLNVLEVVDLGPEAADGVPALAECLKGTDRGERRDAARVLGRIGRAAEAAVPALREALWDPDAEVAKAAAWALGRVDPTAAPGPPE
jgi:HEAT repeat protein